MCQVVEAAVSGMVRRSKTSRRFAVMLVGRLSFEAIFTGPYTNAQQGSLLLPARTPQRTKSTCIDGLVIGSHLDGGFEVIYHRDDSCRPPLNCELPSKLCSRTTQQANMRLPPSVASIEQRGEVSDVDIVLDKSV